MLTTALAFARVVPELPRFSLRSVSFFRSSAFPRRAIDLSVKRNMSAASEFVAANKVYVENFGDKGSLPLPPGKKLIVGESRQPGNILERVIVRIF